MIVIKRCLVAKLVISGSLDAPLSEPFGEFQSLLLKMQMVLLLLLMFGDSRAQILSSDRAHKF